MSLLLIKSAAAAAVGCYTEYKYGDRIVITNHQGLFMVTPTILLGTAFWTLTYGFTAVGRARSKYKELATKDGEKDEEERYGYPNLYAQGTSKHARAFNCVQRSHQHIFETFPLAVLSGVIGAWTFPIMTACSTLMYAAGRYYLSIGYAQVPDGDASKRYDMSPIAWYMWPGLLLNTITAVVSSVMVISGLNK